MKRACVIAYKDFKSLILSPMFFIAAGFSALLMSYSYLRSLKEFGESTMMNAMQFGGENGANIQFTVFMGHISITNLLFIFLLPAITMRLFAEEKKLRTFDLLLTSPVTSLDIALGKFMAAFSAMTILVIISLAYPLLTRFIADFSLKQLLSSYLGLWLVGGCYVAIGVFASSLSESVLLAVILGLIFNLSLWFVAQGSGFFDSPTLVSLMEHLAVGQHFANFVRGTINLSSFAFLLSCISFFVFLTQRVVESTRWR